MFKTLALQESTKISSNTDDESIGCHDSVELLIDLTDSKISIEDTQCSEPMPSEEEYKNVQKCEDDNTLVIDNTGVIEIDPLEHEPEGDRIVNIAFFMKELHRTFDNHAQGIECHFKDWKLVNSRRYGFKTQFFYKCYMCHYEANFWSHPKNSKTLDVNTAITAGTITTGVGFAQTEELFAAANVPCMSEKTYIEHREIVLDEFEKTAAEKMKEAADLEKQIAVEKNETINGKPYIAVVADGSWAKRSYGTGSAYDSLSGVGAIIGYRTRKVLFVGIRNKFCTVCHMAEKNGVKAKCHKCYKNFDRNASSTRMECEALVEGFKFSIPLYGLIFKTLIADGDSSVYQAILDNNPYKELGIIVGKTECSNHLFRNLDRKLKKISETTEPKLRRNRDFVKIRNIVKSNISKIRREIKRLIEYRRQQKQPQHCLSKELREDILNVPSHIFGEHKQCKERGTCENFADANKEINYIRYLKTYNLYLKIMTAITYLSSHSDSLLLNVTNNYAELFHSIVCAEIGGKRVFYGARGSYNAKIAAAVIQHNTQQVLTELHKNVNDCVPSIIENLERRRQIKIDRTRESRKINEKQQKRKRNVKGADAYYGPQSQQPDLSPVIFEQLKKKHVEQLFENAQNWEEIERNTRKQSDCELWLSLRKIMLTASNFGPVCRMRPTTSCATNVKNILFPHVIDTAAMKYGRDMEEIAKQDICSKLKIDIKPCGLFVDINNPYLGASPDGLIDENGLVEIKCPLSAENLTAEEAVTTLPQLKGIFDKRDPNVINRSHRFFYQIQGQLNIARREYCIFAVWTPKSVKTVRLNRDKDFWQNKMLPVLERFYFNCVLPEIIDSRHNRHMPLREPNYIIEAKDKLSKSGNTKRQHVMIASVNEKQNQVIDEKRLKNNISIETNDTVSITETEPDECIIVSHKTNYIPTTDEMASRRRVLDGREISFSSVKENVLPEHSQLNDDSLDLFLRIVAETSRFETQSVHYIEFPQLIRISCSQSVQILGGNCTNHWRCIYFDGTKLYVYDSIPECTYERMASKEKVYISARFPQVVPTEISFEKVQAQPDGTSCGIYAAAFATDIVLGRNPCEETYSNDVDKMRRHFVTIVEGKELLPFPRR